ncbi:hypothetical protein HDU86_004230 [Geranomyces michiganensis]|nr:hypothetical protein HDU86_004230 [Geranomyces michiganensis]
MRCTQSLLFASAACLWAASAVSAQAPTAGPRLSGVCNAAVDKFGCQTTFFLECREGTWQLQNSCAPANCVDIPAYAALCGQNSQTGPAAGGPASTTPVPSPAPNVPSPGSSTPPATAAGTPRPSITSSPSPSSDPNSSAAVQAPPAGDGGSSHTGAIVGGIIGALVLLALILAAIFFWRRRKASSHESMPVPSMTRPAAYAAGGKAQEEGLAMSQGASSSSAGLTAAGLSVTSVLEKKYVVRHEYQPAAEDEVQLKVGDRIRMDLLFNDGWAKGTNETTGQQGLLPVACLQEA